MRLASSAWPSALLILCAPVCARSSRLRKMRAAGFGSVARSRARFVERRRPADVVREQPIEFREKRRVLRAPRSRPPAAPRPARPASRARTCRRSHRNSRARSDRAGRIVSQSCNASKSVRKPVWDPSRRARLDARRHIDAIRPHRSHSELDVGRRSSPPARIVRRIAAISRAASQLTVLPVPPNRAGSCASTSSTTSGSKSSIVADAVVLHADRFDNGPAAAGHVRAAGNIPALRVRVAAPTSSPDLVHDARDFFDRLVDEHADLQHIAGTFARQSPSPSPRRHSAGCPARTRTRARSRRARPPAPRPARA